MRREFCYARFARTLYQLFTSMRLLPGGCDYAIWQF